MVPRATSHLSVNSLASVNTFASANTLASVNTLVDPGPSEASPLLARCGSRYEWTTLNETESIRDVASSHAQDAPLDSSTTSWKPLAAVCAITVVQPLCFELIFPFISQMILDNGIVDSPEEVGFYTGFIESIFQITGIIAILPSSYISNRYGRKPVVLIGTLGMAVSIALFGMSKTYSMMIAMRCIGGTMGGTITACKMMTLELFSDKVRTVRALSLWMISYRIGQIIGQPLGGLLSHPARTMSFFDVPFWREYPFALPCFVASAFALIATALATSSIPETKPKGFRRRQATGDSGVSPHSWRSTMATLNLNAI